MVHTLFNLEVCHRALYPQPAAPQRRTARNPPLEGGSKVRSTFGAGVASATAEAFLAGRLDALLVVEA
ncbi:hypothetical protein C3941_01935 [Kaistia algarum]|nr:hypothetical protein C3941_01935 [Kaistia algarum]